MSKSWIVSMTFKKNKKNETQIRVKDNTWGRKKPRTMNVNYQAAK